MVSGITAKGSAEQWSRERIAYSASALGLLDAVSEAYLFQVIGTEMTTVDMVLSADDCLPC